jgi:surfactin synthase thioesterase subunit
LKIKTKIVLLPGMDGTGLLFEPLVNQLPDTLEAIIINYPRDQRLSYSELLVYVKAKLPKESFILLAESFSGPIAYQLAMDKTININKLIFVASFISNPNPKLSSIMKFLPLSIILRCPIPKSLLSYLCLGKFSNLELASQIKNAINSSNVNVLTHRIKELRTIKLPRKTLDIKCLNFIASNDRLLTKGVSDRISKYCLNAESIKIDGPHFLLQTNALLIINKIMQFKGQ